MTRHRRPARRRPAFVLLEVLVALTVLGVSLAMVLRQMTTCMKAIQRSDRLTTATMLARRLVETWELIPPPQGVTRGDFGDDFPRFSYEVNYRTETVDYEDLPRVEELDRLAYLRTAEVEVYYTDPRSRRATPQRIVRFDTALVSSEKFTVQARIQNSILFDD